MDPNNQNNLQNNNFGNTQSVGPEPVLPQPQPMGQQSELAASQLQSTAQQFAQPIQQSPVAQPQVQTSSFAQPDLMAQQQAQLQTPLESTVQQPVTQPQMQPELTAQQPVMTQMDIAMQQQPQLENLSSQFQPQAQPMPGAQPMTDAEQIAKQKSKKNVIILSIVAGVVVAVCAVVAIIMMNSGNSTQPATPIPEPDTEVEPEEEEEESGTSTGPSVKLAETACEKYGGEFKDASENIDNSVGYSMYVCYADKNGDNVISENDWQFMFYSFEDGELEQYWEQLKTPAENSLITTTVLEDTDEFYKRYDQNTTTGFYNYYVLYKDAVVNVAASDNSFIEDLLVELGFPDRSRASENTQNDGNDASESDDTNKGDDADEGDNTSESDINI